MWQSVSRSRVGHEAFDESSGWLLAAMAGRKCRPSRRTRSDAEAIRVSGRTHWLESSARKRRRKKAETLCQTTAGRRRTESVYFERITTSPKVERANSGFEATALFSRHISRSPRARPRRGKVEHAGSFSRENNASSWNDKRRMSKGKEQKHYRRAPAKITASALRARRIVCITLRVKYAFVYTSNRNSFPGRAKITALLARSADGKYGVIDRWLLISCAHDQYSFISL